jgi:hypothetical protein
MIYKVYITRTVTEHIHVTVDASNWEEATERAGDGKWSEEGKPFEVNPIVIKAHGAKRIDPIELLKVASSR